MSRSASAGSFWRSDPIRSWIVDNLIECGVCVHDPQLAANTLEGIEKAYKGKLCANVNLDQEIVAWKPHEMKNRMAELVGRLGSPQGGLMFRANLLPDATPADIEAICLALQHCCFHCGPGQARGTTNPPASLTRGSR